MFDSCCPLLAQWWELRCCADSLLVVFPTRLWAFHGLNTLLGTALNLVADHMSSWLCKTCGTLKFTALTLDCFRTKIRNWQLVKSRSPCRSEIYNQGFWCYATSCLVFIVASALLIFSHKQLSQNVNSASLSNSLGRHGDCRSDGAPTTWSFTEKLGFNVWSATQSVSI